MAASLARPLLLSELSKALMDMASGKSPGLDGITTEFYKCLWPTIKAKYHQMIMDSISREALPSGATEGLIALLHKGRLRDSLNNWRPITLLNVLYKFFAKALQIRLQPVLMEIISPDQSAFLPMRLS
jgi:hypothetical protein